MFIIAGLGNPKKEYDNTRHNIGFAAVDALAKKHGIRIMDIKHKAMTGKGIINGHKVILAKPLTYMNLSGESIRPLVDYYKADPGSELIILSDDIALMPGQIRVRKRGSAGGHNGLKNIISQLQTEEFQRVRIGVGEKPRGYDLADYVLGRFSGEEAPLIRQGIDQVVEAVEMILDGEIDRAMNEFNRKTGRLKEGE